jgi:hypothetical protein
VSQDAKVEFVGAPQAAADMSRWARDLGPQLAQDGTAFGQRIADTVAGKVPVLTGALASSVRVTADSEGVAVGLGEGLPYAGWIEFGGSRGRPLVPEGRYLYPTALAAEGEWGDYASQQADATVGRFPWSTPTK